MRSGSFSVSEGKQATELDRRIHHASASQRRAEQRILHGARRTTPAGSGKQGLPRMWISVRWIGQGTRVGHSAIFTNQQSDRMLNTSAGGGFRTSLRRCLMEWPVHACAWVIWRFELPAHPASLRCFDRLHLTAYSAGRARAAQHRVTGFCTTLVSRLDALVVTGLGARSFSKPAEC